MDSPLGKLFLLLQNKINTITVGGAKAISHIDRDTGQLADERPALTFPAILIDFAQIRWTNGLENAKFGEGPVILKLVTTPFSASSNNTPELYKEKSLSDYELEHLLTNTLDGWCPDQTTDIFSPLDLQTTSPDNSRADLRIRNIPFAISIDDYSGIPPQQTTPATPNITQQITFTI